jgi:hypothetical protein
MVRLTVEGLQWPALVRRMYHSGVSPYERERDHFHRSLLHQCALAGAAGTMSVCGLFAFTFA